MSSEGLARPYRVVLFAAATVAAAAVIVLVIDPLLVLFGGVLFALVLRGIAHRLSRVTKIAYGVWVAVLLFTIVAALAVGAVLLGPSLRDQVNDLARRLPDAARHLVQRLRHEPIAQTLTQGRAPDAPADPKTIATGAAVAVSTVLEVLGALVVVFFVGAYGAARPGDYARVVLALTPARDRDRMRAVMREVTTSLTRWLLGRLVAMVFVGVACSIAFTLLHVPLALTLGIFAGLLTFVEYVGAIASAVPPVLLALTKSPESALAVLAVYTVLHVFEGYVITPLAARASVRLPPALTLAGQLVFATLVGPLGLTFSTPLLVVGVVAVKTWRSARPEASAETASAEEPRGRAGTLAFEG